jgi:hypothetical protein
MASIQSWLPNGLRSRTCPTGCGAGVGEDSAWEQEKLEATLREMLAADWASELPANTPALHTKCDGVHIILVLVQEALLGAFFQFYLQPLKESLK